LKDDLTIRQFTMDDYDTVYALWSRAGEGIHLRRSDERSEILKKIQRDPDLFLLAEVDGQIVGAVMGGFDGRRGMVYHLAVDRPYQGRGIGKRLMAELESRLKVKGCIKYYLLVTHENVEAQAFYRHLGWEDMTVALKIYGKEIGE